MPRASCRSRWEHQPRPACESEGGGRECEECGEQGLRRRSSCTPCCDAHLRLLNWPPPPAPPAARLQALQTLRTMHCAGVKCNLQTYVALMKAFARVGDVDRARAVLTTMKWEGIRPNEFAYRWAVCGTKCRGRGAWDAAGKGYVPLSSNLRLHSLLPALGSHYPTPMCL